MNKTNNIHRAWIRLISLRVFGLRSDSAGSKGEICVRLPWLWITPKELMFEQHHQRPYQHTSIERWVAFPFWSTNKLSANKWNQKWLGQMFCWGPRESWCRKGKIGGKREKKKRRQIKDKIRTWQLHWLLNAGVGPPAAAAVPIMG